MLLRNLYNYRRYIWRNAWTDLRYQYTGTGIGVFWNILNPLLLVLVYSLVFSRLIELRSGGTRDTSYVLYLCTGLFPWLAFSEAVVQGSNTFLQNAGFLRHLAIPPEIFVAKNSLTSIIYLLTMLLVLLPLGLLLGEPLSWSMLLLPLLTLLLQGLGFGLSLALASLRVFFRDIGEILRVLMRTWMWTMPIIYQESLFPENAQALFSLNPPYAFIRAIRTIFLEQQAPSSGTWAIMLAWLLVFVLIGTFILQKLQIEIRDVL